jgi:hypothetical protein
MSQHRGSSLESGFTGSVRDPSFARVAAVAAIELDNALLRSQHREAPKEVRVQAVRTLAVALKRIASHVENARSIAAVNEHLDPLTASVLLRTFGKVAPKESLKELPGATAHVASVLDKVAHSSATTAEEIKYARDFCRALSGQAATTTSSAHPLISFGLARRLSTR